MQLLIIIIALFTLPTIAFPATINVPGDYDTIQAAIDASVDGDTVLVDPGTYLENIDFKGKGITVQGSHGSEKTVIDGGNPVNPDHGSVVSFHNGEGPDAVLAGFTITRGNGTYHQISTKKYFCGGGVFCKGSSPTIVNNTLMENSVQRGGGIGCYQNACPVISNNLITQNTASLYGGGIDALDSTPVVTLNNVTENTAPSGGGILITGASSPIISANLIVGNSGSGDIVAGGGLYISGISPLIEKNVVAYNALYANQFSYGAGIHCMLCPDCVISDNIIQENMASHGGFSSWGGGIFCSLCDNLGISNNLITGNVSEGTYFSLGGGLYLSEGESSSLVNNTITLNQCIKSSSWCRGGGIYCYGISLAIRNSIFWNNEADEGTEISLEYKTHLSNDYSDVKGGSALVYVSSQSILEWGPDNIDSDPLFVDPVNGDFHLTWLSPCINRGTNDGAPSEDFEGDPRPYMGTVDMGADEFTGTHPLECDIFTISETSGGVLNFSLNGGVENAGCNYLLYASVSGTAPGTSLPGGLKILPINWDMFTNIVANINYPDSIIFTDFFGTLDPNGQMNAVFNTNGPVPGMQGYTVSFAYPLQGPPWDFVSNPINIEVIQ